MLDEQLYTVETPEQIDLAYDVAGIGSRFLAALIDHVIMAGLLSFGCVLLSLALDRAGVGLDSMLVLSLFVIAIFLALCGYYIFFETVWNGQTPGKRMVGIRMVRVGGRPIGFLGSTIRNLIRMADFLPVLYGVGILTMFINRRSCRLGDLAAGVLAVKEGQQVTLDMLSAGQVSDQPLVAPATASEIPNIEAVTPADVTVVESYLRRRDDLAVETRRELNRLLMDGLQRRLGYAINTAPNMDPDAFLIQLVAEKKFLAGQHALPEPVADQGQSMV